GGADLCSGPVARRDEMWGRQLQEGWPATHAHPPLLALNGNHVRCEQERAAAVLCPDSQRARLIGVVEPHLLDEAEGALRRLESESVRLAELLVRPGNRRHRERCSPVSSVHAWRTSVRPEQPPPGRVAPPPPRAAASR